MELSDKRTRNLIFNKTKGMCSYCGCKLDFNNFHIDHSMPKSSGGSNSYENLFPSCPHCNSMKGCVTLEEYRERIKNLPKTNHSVRNYLNYVKVVETKIVFYFERIGVK